jgi:hypothetical protein
LRFGYQTQNLNSIGQTVLSYRNKINNMNYFALPQILYVGYLHFYADSFMNESAYCYGRLYVCVRNVSGSRLEF